MKPSGQNSKPKQVTPRTGIASFSAAGATAVAASATPSTLSSNIGFQSNCKGNKKSLLIGINYFGQSGELRGCINDVNNVKKLIMSMGFPGSAANMRVLTDDSRKSDLRPTRKNIIDGIYSHLANNSIITNSILHMFQELSGW